MPIEKVETENARRNLLFCHNLAADGRCGGLMSDNSL